MKLFIEIFEKNYTTSISAVLLRYIVFVINQYYTR